MNYPITSAIRVLREKKVDFTPHGLKRRNAAFGTSFGR